MLPENPVTNLTDQYAVRGYLSEIMVTDNSPLIGQHVFESDLSKMNFTILRVIRKGRTFMPTSTTQIKQNDVMLVEGRIDELIKVKETEGIEIKADLLAEELQNEDLQLAEVIITPRSNVINCTFQAGSFLQKYGLKVLALHGSALFQEKIKDIPLAMGDVLLVQGPTERIEGGQSNQGISMIPWPVCPRFIKKAGPDHDWGIYGSHCAEYCRRSSSFH